MTDSAGADGMARVQESLRDLLAAGPEGGVCEDCLADVTVLTESVIQEAAAEHTSDDTVDGPLRVVTVRVTDGAGFTQAEQTLSLTDVHRRHSRPLRLEDAQREAGEAADRLRVRLEQQAAARME